ncbi:MAG: 16S rRNA (uracil(1498)-N(3))-methyltransferase [Cyclobacteriaceae bacterium]|nr:16S rRNA (uracil(1498)-N(3))-methyltransferase [Cyclobacteriaceae bacterium]
MNFFFLPEIIGGSTRLSPEESRHCTRVLRKKTGDYVNVLDGKGSIYQCRILKADPDDTLFEIIEKRQQPSRDYSIHIAIAPTKNMDRMEWFIEKSVEIGIDKISFIRCRNSERTSIKTDRMQKKAVSALKQSGNLFLPELSEMTDINNFISIPFENNRKYIAHAETGAGNPLMRNAGARMNYVVMVGPEGDFTGEELKKISAAGFVPVSLSPMRLRTETAGLVACMILHLINTQI